MTDPLHFADGGRTRVRAPRERFREMNLEMDVMTEPRTKTLNTKIPSAALVVATLGLSSLLAGCGMHSAAGVAGGGTTGLTIHVTGNVHGGQQPVAGSTIQLYAIGMTGLKSSSTPLLSTTVTTDTTGAFNISGLYNCNSVPSTDVYITATGGDPGNLGHPNSAIAMVAALGQCSTLSSSTFIQINEVTTVAAGYALAPFASDLSHVGASGTNPSSIVTAFTNAGLLANFSTGVSGAGLQPGVTVSSTAVNTVADILASCINTTGPTSSNCTTLFAATGATDTFGATLAIAKSPGAPAITALYSMVNAQSPAQPSYTTQPSDFAIGVTTTAGGTLATPYGIALDPNGDAYVTNASGTTLTQIFSNMSLAGNSTAPNLFGAQGVAVDRLGNIWVANTAGNTVVKFTPAQGGPTSVSFTAGGISAPTGIAMDSAGNAWIANFNGNSVTELTSAGAAASGSPFTGSGNNILQPQGIAVAANGSIYVTSGTGSIVNLSNAGAFVTTLSDGTLQGPTALAVDTSSRVLATGFTTGTAVGGAISQFAAGGTAVSGSPFAPGFVNPAGIATDGTSIFVANSAATGGLAQFAYGSATPVSPATGFAGLNLPVGVAIDASGCVWITNSGNNTVTKLIGLAIPVLTPIARVVGP
jgi:streptogramin lyase